MTDNSFIERKNKTGTIAGSDRKGGTMQRKNTKDPEDKFQKMNFTDFTVVPKANSKQFVPLLSPNNGYEIWSDSLTVQFGSKT